MSGPRIEVVVDELVLRGVAPEHANEVAAAIESRLAVLGERWTADAGGRGIAPRDQADLRAPALAVAAGSPARLGEAVAGAVFEGVLGGPR